MNKKEVMKYAVLKGVVRGDFEDLDVQAEFCNKKDALKYFNRIKKITKNWCCSSVETQLVKYTDDLCEEFDILELYQQENK